MDKERRELCKRRQRSPLYKLIEMNCSVADQEFQQSAMQLQGGYKYLLKHIDIILIIVESVSAFLETTKLLIKKKDTRFIANIQERIEQNNRILQTRKTSRNIFPLFKKTEEYWPTILTTCSIRFGDVSNKLFKRSTD